jgi:hypothetical protein
LLDDNLVSLMAQIPYETSKKLIGNQNNFLSIKTIYASLMRYKAFDQKTEIALARKAIQGEIKDIDRKSKSLCVYCIKEVM